MKRIEEPQLREYATAGVVSAAQIVRDSQGYMLLVTLTWQEHPVVLFTQRNRARIWRNLDRMIAYLDDVVPCLSKVELMLREDLPAGED